MSAQLHGPLPRSRDEQRLAELFLHDVERGDVEVEAGMTLRDYITRYAAREKNEQVDKLVDRLGVNRSVVEEFLCQTYRRGEHQRVRTFRCTAFLA